MHHHIMQNAKQLSPFKRNVIAMVRIVLRIRILILAPLLNPFRIGPIMHHTVLLILCLFVLPVAASPSPNGPGAQSFAAPITSQTNAPFPYVLSKNKDIALSIASAGLFTTGMIAAYSVKEISAVQLNSLRATDVNAFDRPATQQWSPASSTASYVTAAMSGALPLGLVIGQLANKKIRNGLTLSLMYAQTMGLNVGFTGMMKAAAQRRRPFLYNTNISTKEKLEQKGTQRSFFSQHTSIAFCSAVFLSKTFSDIYPSSRWRYVIWPSSLLLASTTGIFRFTAGKHFPTDLLAGAALGALFGFFIPALHKTQQRPNRKFTVSVYPISGETKGLGALVLF